MIWRKISVKTKEEAVDILSAYLLDRWDIEGVEIEDGKGLTEEEAKIIFADILPEETSLNGEASLSFYLEILPEEEKKKRKAEVEKEFLDENVDHSYTLNSSNIFTEEECSEILSDLKRELSEMSEYTEIGEGKISVSETEDKDWMNAWKDFFHSFRVGKILIKPSWEEEEPKEGEFVLSLDPGTSFGTGQHETTKLCLLSLEKYLKEGDRVLDFGTGSGILGIASLKMGAKEVFATDLDPLSKAAVSENLKVNDISEKNFQLFIENILSEEESARSLREVLRKEPFDIVCANILAPVIVSLTPLIPSFLKKDGFFISSGILCDKAGEVRKALESEESLEIIEESVEGEWHAFIARKK